MAPFGKEWDLSLTHSPLFPFAAVDPSTDFLSGSSGGDHGSGDNEKLFGMGVG